MKMNHSAKISYKNFFFEIPIQIQQKKNSIKTLEDSVLNVFFVDFDECVGLHFFASIISH